MTEDSTCAVDATSEIVCALTDAAFTTREIAPAAMILRVSMDDSRNSICPVIGSTVKRRQMRAVRDLYPIGFRTIFARRPCETRANAIPASELYCFEQHAYG